MSLFYAADVKNKKKNNAAILNFLSQLLIFLK